MHYFLIQQDESIFTAPKIKNFKNSFFNKRELTDKANLLYVKEEKTIDYIDFIDRPLLLVSDSFKQVLKKYSPSLECKVVVLSEFEKQNQEIYWNIELPEVKCLSQKTEYYPDTTFKKIVIDNNLAEEYSMFKITNKIKTYYIIRLELAESIIRRGIGGFILQELDEEV